MLLQTVVDWIQIHWMQLYFCDCAGSNKCSAVALTRGYGRKRLRKENFFEDQTEFSHRHGDADSKKKVFPTLAGKMSQNAYRVQCKEEENINFCQNYDSDKKHLAINLTKTNYKLPNLPLTLSFLTGTYSELILLISFESGFFFFSAGCGSTGKSLHIMLRFIVKLRHTSFFKLKSWNS